jgi:TonB family protein
MGQQKEEGLMRLTLGALLFCLTTMAAEDWKIWARQGYDAFRRGNYPDAINAFQTAAELSPDEFLPRFYLGMSWYAQYIPGAQSLENLEVARNAKAALKQALQMNPNNLILLETLAVLSRSECYGSESNDPHRFDEAVSWYHQWISADPLNQEAYYALGEITWVKWARTHSEARITMSLAGEDGPINDTRVRQELKAHRADIEEGIANIEKALEIDPEYDAAMSYMNLLLRQRADLSDTDEGYRRDVQAAEKRAKEARAAHQRNMDPSIRGASGKMVVYPELPQEPEPNSQAGGPKFMLRIGLGSTLVPAKRQEASLIKRVDPAYPPAARTARIEGIVRLRVTIDGEGNVTATKVMSGDNALVEAAQDAVQQWKYQPTVINMIPVEVLTTVDVRFALDSGAD